MTTTYVSCYWIVDNNKKNNNIHYLDKLPKTLELIKDCNLIFYYNEDNIANVVKKNFKGNLKLIKKSINDLPTNIYAEDYFKTGIQQNNIDLIKVNRNDEKGLAHYQREYIKSGPEVYKKLFTIWTSKLFLIEECIKNNPFNTEYFSWIDASACRVNLNNIYYLKKYDDTAIFNTGYSKMKYYGKHLNVCCFFMIGHRNIWEKIIPLFKNKLIECKTSKYCHDEETILNLVYMDNKKYFKSFKFEDETNKQNSKETNFFSAKQFVNMKISKNAESLSGPGSHLNNTKVTVEYLSKFIKDNNIKSVLDLGCGDWNWFKLINLNGASYEGWDAHSDMIYLNNKNYGTDKIKFSTKDIITEEYPNVDLIICRDVLFHLNLNFSTKIVEKVKRASKYFISTSFNSKEINNNITAYCSIKNWGFTIINLNIEPFNLKEYLIDSTNEKANNINNYIRYINTYKF